MDTLYKYWNFIAHFYLLGRYSGKKLLRKRKTKSFELHKKVLLSFVINAIILYFEQTPLSSVSSSISFDTPRGAAVLLIMLTMYFSFNALLAFICGLTMSLLFAIVRLKHDFHKLMVIWRTLKLTGFRHAPKSTRDFFESIFGPILALLLLIFVIVYVFFFFEHHKF